MSPPPITAHDYDFSFKTSDFVINLTATDFSGFGILDTYYRINLGPIKKVSLDGQPLISTESLYNNLQFWSRDNAGNQEVAHNLTNIRLDKSAPHLLQDNSGLNGGTFQSSHSRLISIEAEDNVLLANQVTLHYIRTGFDIVPQQTLLQLDVSGTHGIYSALLDENPDTEHFIVTGIEYWVTGSDFAGNTISIGGTQSTPLAAYTINDLIPVFRTDYQPNIRIGQTETVQNIGISRSYVNGETVSLEVSLNRSTYIVTADFSSIDSDYASGTETVINLGSGIYRILYTISPTNSFIGTANITITAADLLSNSASDSSFSASIHTGFTLISVVPGHTSTGISVDSSFILSFNDSLANDPLITGRIFLTDEMRNGIPLDITLFGTSAIVKPISRLKPSASYKIHINAGIRSDSLGDLNAYYESLFTTGTFFSPLLPIGYTATNQFDLPLTLSDTSLKVSWSNGFVLWQDLPNSNFNSIDLRHNMLSVNNTENALLWFESLPDSLRIAPDTIELEINGLSDLNNPRIRHSIDSTILLQAGVIQAHTVIFDHSFSSGTLHLSLKQLLPMYIEESATAFLGYDVDDRLVRLIWCLSDELNVGEATLVKKIGGIPANETDGDIIYRGPGHKRYDIDVTNGVTYGYRVFVQDLCGGVYNYDLATTAIPEPRDYGIDISVNEYEHKLVTHFIEDLCAPDVSLCANAVVDIPNNGNEEDQVVVFEEYVLNREDHLVEFCRNSATILVNERTAGLIKNFDVFMLLEPQGLTDGACNKSPPALILDIVEHPDPNEFRIINAVPVS